MTWLALHTDPQLTLASDELLVPAVQVPAFGDAIALAQELARLRTTEAQRIEQRLAAAHAQGLREGLAQARREAHEAAAEQLAQTLGQLGLRAHEQHAALREAVLELSLLVVRRIAGELDREQVLAALAAQLLDRLDAEERQRHGLVAGSACVLRLHPEMLDTVRRRVAEQRADQPDPGLAIEWRADASLDPLDAVIETPAGRLLGGLEAQLEHIRAVLREQHPGRADAQHGIALSGSPDQADESESPEALLER